MIEPFPSRSQFQSNPSARILLDWLENIDDLASSDSLVYLGFPLYRDDDGSLIAPDVLLISRLFGVIGFTLLGSSAQSKDLEKCQEAQEQVPSYIYSRLVKNKSLRRRPTQLLFPVDSLIADPAGREQNRDVISSELKLQAYFADLQHVDIEDEIFQELISTIDGAKGLVKPVRRVAETPDIPQSMAQRVDAMESAIMTFDSRQKHGIMGKVTGPQRIRGLAGSGKTVVLTMMAAQALLHNPNARIAYTFSTKSLYQHVKRLITRFYRQFDDRDPDWEKSIHVMHGWGGSSTPGLYSTACARHGVRAVNFGEAGAYTSGDRLDYACNNLFSQTAIRPHYDFIFVDEAQDFPISFLRLCYAFAMDGKFVIGYDDLQTIFQPNSPDSASIFGVDGNGNPVANFEEDIVLHKCYRNPREVLVTAHSLGFGIYSKKIVQMIESADHWTDIGYEVVEGDFRPGSIIRVRRPAANSLEALSVGLGFQDLINFTSCDGIQTECSFVASRIVEDLRQDLRPEDILVVCVDDRNAKNYLNRIAGELEVKNIKSNNLHEDSFGVRDFSKLDRVTLSTVHKAKGNEAFMVYVVGCDAVMTNPDVRRRNMLFTALTRAKGWVRMSGCWDPNSDIPLLEEYKEAEKNFPDLVFPFPDTEALRIMRRDLDEVADKKLKAERLLDVLGEDFTVEELQAMIKAKRKRKK